MHSASAVSVQVPIIGVRIPDAECVVKQLFSSTGEEAIMYMKDHQADLMVLCMIMDPGMDGLDTKASWRRTDHQNPASKKITGFWVSVLVIVKIESKIEIFNSLFLLAEVAVKIIYDAKTRP
jgi:hypothetical protein